MFPIPRLYAILAVGASSLLVAALLVFAGYRAGADSVQADWERIEKDRAESIIGLAQRYVAADAEATRLRAEQETVSTQRVTEIRREIVKIPVRIGCGHSPAEHQLLLDTFCARHAADPQCVQRGVPEFGSTGSGS